MAAVETPEAWVNKQVVVNLVVQPGTTSEDRTASKREGQLQGINDWGVTVLSTYDSGAPGEYQRTEFYPWAAVRSISPAEELRGGPPPV